MDGSTHPCATEQCGGGVARNMAEALWRLRGGRTRLLTAVGDDADGEYLDGIAPGLLLDGCIVKNARTPSYAAVLDSRGECLLGLGNMALHNNITPDFVNKHINVLNKAPLVILDGNLPQTTIDFVLAKCQQLRKPVFFEPTDRRKALKLIRDNYTLSYASPNLSELRAIAQYINSSRTISIKNDYEFSEILELSSIVAHVIKFIIITMGSKGVITVNNLNNKDIRRYYSTEIISKVENVSGAGDCFASGFIHGLLSGFNEPQCMFIGFEAAKMALLSKNTVPNNLEGINSLFLTKAKYNKLK